jgi:hypothetical protein
MIHSSNSSPRWTSPERERRANSAWRTLGLSLVVALVASGQSRADQPMAPPTCAMRLTVEVTVDVPNPTDGGFISSLLGNNTGYSLFLLKSVDDSHVVLQLQGPGEKRDCQQVVDNMRNDGRVQSIDVN